MGTKTLIADGEDSDQPDLGVPGERGWWCSVAYSWGGRLRRVPREWRYPKVNIQTGWSLWWYGNQTVGVAPFRILSPLDLEQRQDKKVWNEWGAVFRKMEAYLRAHEKFVSVGADIVPSPQVVARMYEDCAPLIRSITNGSRRSDQLSIGTLAKRLRKVKGDAALKAIVN